MIHDITVVKYHSQNQYRNNNKKQYEKQLISYEEQRNALRKTLHRQSHVLSFSIENVNEHISFSRRWFATAYNELCFAKKIIEIV